MNQEYRGRVKRHLEAGGDPKYVNVKRKADARHKSEALERKTTSDIGKGMSKVRGGKKRKRDRDAMGGYHDESHPEADAMGYVRE